MSKPKVINWDIECYCDHDGWSHICEDPQCPRGGHHVERCTEPDCKCRVYRPADLDVKVKGNHYADSEGADVVLHNTTDVAARELSRSDIRAAVEDQFGYRVDDREFDIYRRKY